jgi:hypothetical protein
MKSIDSKHLTCLRRCGTTRWMTTTMPPLQSPTRTLSFLATHTSRQHTQAGQCRQHQRRWFDADANDKDNTSHPRNHPNVDECIFEENNAANDINVDAADAANANNPSRQCNYPNEDEGIFEEDAGGGGGGDEGRGGRTPGPMDSFNKKQGEKGQNKVGKENNFKCIKLRSKGRWD